tara:strand:- start:2057 stop:2665 length:609 start_codon:yes stop_codon:yes gene_type:complete
MSENILQVLKLTGLNKLAENAKISAEEMQLASNVINPPPAPAPMPPIPMQQPITPNQRPMNVRPADPEKFNKIQGMIKAFETPSSYDNVLAQRMQPTMQAKAGTEGMTMSFGSGPVPGEGHGMQDNVQMPIMEKGDQVATLAVSPDEYIVDAYTMAALGNGSADAGADVMDKVVKEIRQKAFGTTEQPNQINGLASLRSAIG